MPRLKPDAPKKEKQERTEEELHRFKKGKLKSSSGEKIKDLKQAIAIALSESGQAKKNKPKTKKKKIYAKGPEK